MTRITNPQLYARIQSYFEQQVMYWKNKFTLTTTGKRKHLTATQAAALAMRDVFHLKSDPFLSSVKSIDRSVILQFVPTDYEERMIPICNDIEPRILRT
ncbi:MAG: hypothetical protein MJZ30_11635 [Paludibacteraceae bacterium]|nr:hypothetical protein [Paludibacteraceae bacterium]